MDIVQTVASATQLVSSMILAVSALEQAYKNVNEAQKRIRALEELLYDLQNVMRSVKMKHVDKLHNQRLETQIQSLNGLIERLNTNIGKARRLVTKNKSKEFVRVMWISMTGDPLSKLIQSIKDDLDWWIEMQKLSDSVEKVLLSTVGTVDSILKVNSEKGFPVSSKFHYIRKLIEKEASHKVVLIVGLSGIGKSCLARQIAADPPAKFVDGAVELIFGQWCSIAACNGSRIEYQKRLAQKLYKLLVQIGFLKKSGDAVTGNLEDACCALQTALFGKSILILLDDVWEQDIVERFVKLYDNYCRYLVTTRNESVYEITEADKVEISKDDTREISKEILLYHSLLGIEELPPIAESLLDRCGHHPLTVAVMGKALRKETRELKWERAINNLSTYAECAPGPVSYVNEKEAENTLTIFRSFEFSLEAMPENCKRLFIVLAVVDWAEPVPETVLEALWSVLGQETLFPLVVCKLVEGSLLIKLDDSLLYHVHDMVALYLENKIDDAIQSLLIETSPDLVASVSPWLLVFGKDSTQMAAELKMKSLISIWREKQVVVTLENIVHALMACKSISELETSRMRFNKILGPSVVELVSTGSQDKTIAAARVITIIFNQEEYFNFVCSLDETDQVGRLISICSECNDVSSKATLFALVAKFVEYGKSGTIDTIMENIPMDQLAGLLDPDAEEWHEIVFTTLMSLIKAGKSKAVKLMIASEIDKKLIALVENSSEVVQHNVVVILKTFNEHGFPLQQGCLQPGTLDMLPWRVRLSLENYVLSDKSIFLSPKPHLFQDLLKILNRDNEQVVESLSDLLPIIEKAGDPKIRDMIMESQLLEKLIFLLRHGDDEQNRARVESTFLLMKLACAGGEPIIKKFLDLNIVHELVKMLLSKNDELQDSAYTTLHQLVFGKGGSLVLNKLNQSGDIETIVHSLDRKFVKTKEVCMLLLVDLAEIGSKACIEKIISCQVIEKLVNLENLGAKFAGAVVKFTKALDMCKNLSNTERRVIKQEVIRKVRAAVKGSKLESSLTVSVEACTSESSRGNFRRKTK